jgi:2,4-dienoyl-CoA reductase-like NADH-dependent reductase (Old Yellow Enzyme family)/thioredoxin reductase
MSTQFPHLFQPLTLRHKTLKHRLTFGAHTANMAEDGLPGARHLGYYSERARGGAAMIVVEPVPAHRTGVLTRGNFRHQDDSIIPPFRQITDACHDFDTVMIHQIYHVGQHGDADNAFEPSWSPSGLPSYHDADGSHRVSEWSNRRDDRWGGSLENRVRFSTEIIRRIRALAGEDFIVGLAVSLDPEIEVALGLEALQEVVAYHDERGLIDYVTCGTGSYFDFSKLIPTFLFEDKLGARFAEGLKAVVSHARVQAESHIRTPENADTVIGSGQADMVSIVRGQIADPHMANKARAGRADEVRPCISCNQMCWGRRSRDYWISCVVNPSAGREFQWGGDRFAPAERPRRVLVVGGGLAGLETARVAAERGHRVTLAEAAPQVGGQARLAGLQPRRGQILDLLDWYEAQLQRLQVELRLNAPLDAEEVADFEAEAIVLATGSLPSGTGFQRALPQLDRLPGLERGNVWSAEDVMGRAARPGAQVLVLDEGGNWRGCGTAWHLAEASHQVTLVTPHAMVGKELVRTSADFPLRVRLRKLGVVAITEAAVGEWHGDGATIVNLLDGTEERLACNTLVLATANRAETDLQEALAGSGKEIHAVGDCVAPRQFQNATFEGRRLGLRL